MLSTQAGPQKVLCGRTNGWSEVEHGMQVFKKLEVMFQVSVEQRELKQQTQQQAGWIAAASQQDMHACSPDSSYSSEGDPTWSDLGYESWTLL